VPSRSARFLLAIALLSQLSGPCVQAAEPVAAPPSKVLPDAPEHDLVLRVCSGCHAPDVLASKRHTATEWDDIIAKMVDHGAQATDTEQERILAYLVRFYGESAAQ